MDNLFNHIYILASNGLLFPDPWTLRPLSSEGSNTCHTSSAAKFFAKVAFNRSARISSVPNRLTVNEVTLSALSVFREGA